MKPEPAVCFSFDLDWAPEPMLHALDELLQSFGLAATLFCTHRSPAVERVTARPRCETALHPNFTAGGNEAATLEELRAFFPGARGVRNHRLYYHSGLLPLFHRAGLSYLSNDLCFLEPNLAAYYDWSGMVRLPIYWEDDVHCLYFNGEFSVDALALESPGLKVLSFHPVHLWLNTRDMAEYQQVKARVYAGDKLDELRRGGRGVRTLFEQVVRRVAAASLPTLGELAERFRSAAAYRGKFLRGEEGHGG